MILMFLQEGTVVQVQFKVGRPLCLGSYEAQMVDVAAHDSLYRGLMC